jgi:hypothetical protein
MSEGVLRGQETVLGQSCVVVRGVWGGKAEGLRRMERRGIWDSALEMESMISMAGCRCQYTISRHNDG